MPPSLKANSGSKGDSSQVQVQVQEISRDPDQDLEQDQVDHVNPPEEEGGLASEDDEDPVLQQGDPDLSQLVLTEKEQQDFDSFNEASTSSQIKKGKTPLCKVSQENTKFYSQAQQAIRQPDTISSSQANAQAPILARNEAGSQHQLPQLTSAQPKVVDPAVDQAPAQGPANFPLILPQRQQLPVVVGHRDRDPFAEDEDSFSIDLDNEAALGEKQAR